MLDRLFRRNEDRGPQMLQFVNDDAAQQQMVVGRLDQALGREEEAIGPRRPVAALIAERRFAEPISSEEDIAATLADFFHLPPRPVGESFLGKPR